MNVNLVLWCLWSAQGFAEPDTATLRRAIEIAGQWEGAVVAPLRQVRRRLKAGFDGAGVDQLREDVKALELRAEREVQSMLEALAQKQLTPANCGDRSGRARRSLASYARTSGAARSAGFSISLLEDLIGLTLPTPGEPPDAHKGDDVNG